MCHDPNAFALNALPLCYAAANHARHMLAGEDIDDLAQYAVIACWKHRREYRARKAAPSTWITMVASRALISLMRERKSQRRLFQRAAAVRMQQGMVETTEVAQ